MRIELADASGPEPAGGCGRNVAWGYHPYSVDVYAYSDPARLEARRRSHGGERVRGGLFSRTRLRTRPVVSVTADHLKPPCGNQSN